MSYVNEVLRSKHQHGDGPFATRSINLLMDLTGSAALLTPSCTHALEIASMLAGIGPGDEVILPSFTFTSAATAVVQFGGTPVFVDIDPETACIDTSRITAAITDRTKAISWVNYAGNAPDFDALVEIGNLHNLFMIEDNAHSLGGSQNGKKLGTVGHVSTSSFHATKNIQCGEGGAIIVNSAKHAQQAAIIREKGTDRSSYLLGEVKKYQWVDKGSSYLLAESLAAILLGQLENYQEIQARRISTWEFYESALRDPLAQHGIEILRPNASNVAHMFALIFPSNEMRELLSSKLGKLGIEAYTHYQPLHSSVAGLRYGRTVGDMGNTLKFSLRILRLPLWSSEMKEEKYIVVDRLINILKNQL